MSKFHQANFYDSDIKNLTYNPIRQIPILMKYDIDKICERLNISSNFFKEKYKQSERRTFIYEDILVNLISNIKKELKNKIEIDNKKIQLNICTYYERCKNCKCGRKFQMPIDFKDDTTKIFNFCYHYQSDKVNVYFCSIDGDIELKKNSRSISFKTFFPAIKNNIGSSFGFCLPKDILDAENTEDAGDADNNYLLNYICDKSKCFKTVSKTFENNDNDFPVTFDDSKVNDSKVDNPSLQWTGVPKLKLNQYRPSSPSSPTISRSISDVSEVSDVSSISLIEKNLNHLSPKPIREKMQIKLNETFGEDNDPTVKSIMTFFFEFLVELDSRNQSLRHDNESLGRDNVSKNYRLKDSEKEIKRLKCVLEKLSGYDLSDTESISNDNNSDDENESVDSNF